jgi:branched-chain amino acid transport system substrate-binding protein
LRSSNRTMRVLALLAVIAVVGAACSKKSNTGTGGTTGATGGGTKDVNIAFMGDLSGANKQLVASPYQAAQLAFDQFNSSQTAVKVTIVGEDTQGSPDQSPAIAQKVAADQSFVGVIGPAFSGESGAAGPILDGAGIPFITPSATDDALSTHGWTHWFRAVGNNSSEAGGAAPYITQTLAPTCTFVASDGSAYGHGLAAIVESDLTAAGATVEPEEQVAPTNDYSALVTKIKSSGCEAIFYGGYVADAPKIRKQMNDAGLTSVVMVGGDGIQANDMIANSGPAPGAEGTIAVVPSASITISKDPAAVQFVSDYKAKFGQDPEIYAGEGWDIAQMYIAAFKAGKTDRQGITDYVHALSGSQGLTKSFTFQTNGELAADSVIDFIYQIKDGAWIVLGSTKDLGLTTG